MYICVYACMFTIWIQVFIIYIYICQNRQLYVICALILLSIVNKTDYLSTGRSCSAAPRAGAAVQPPTCHCTSGGLQTPRQFAKGAFQGNQFLGASDLVHCSA